MHELAIVEALADGIRSYLPADAALVRAIVEVGSLEHLDAEVLQSAWTAFTDAPPLLGGRLEILWTPVRVRCRSCGHEYAPDRTEYLVCPRCDQARPDILEGWGVTLRTIEADVGDEDLAATSLEGGYEER